MANRVRLNQSKSASPEVCLMMETTQAKRILDLGRIAEGQNRYCAKCKRWFSEQEAATKTCDLFGNWSER